MSSSWFAHWDSLLVVKFSIEGTLGKQRAFSVWLDCHGVFKVRLVKLW